MKSTRKPRGWGVDDGWTEQCDLCKRWVPAKDLLRQLQVGTIPVGRNLVTNSSYDSSAWTCTATDGESTSIGRSSYYNTVDNDGNVTHHGIQTWTGDGVYSYDSSIDCSSYTTVLVRAVLGKQQQDTSAYITAEIGLKNGSTTYASRSWTVSGSKYVWDVVTITDVAEAHKAALKPYVSVTTIDGTNEWWLDDFQAIPDETSPHHVALVRTTGAAVNNTTDTAQVRAVVVCKKCKAKRLDLINDIDPTTAEPPEIAEDLEVD